MPRHGGRHLDPARQQRIGLSTHLSIRAVALRVRGDLHTKGAIAIPAIGVHHTATVDEPWDRNAAVSAMPNDESVLHYCFAWEATDAGDKKGDYSFPHHKTKGGPANLPACRNGLSRLEGSDIPEGDKAGVRAHLQAHLDDANKKEGGTDDLVDVPVTDQASWARAVRLGNLGSSDRVREHAARAQRFSDKRECFRFTNLAGEDGSPAQLDLYDEIGFWGIDANEFKRLLNQVSGPLTVHVNSPGGDVFDGIAITNMLRSHKAGVHVIVEGLAASAASFIAMAGQTLTMMPNSTLMIHDASGMCIGNATDMQQMTDLLDKISDNIASIYAAKAGGSVEDWRAAMKTETWYTADEAVDAGLADRVGDTDTTSDVAVATANWNYSFFNYAGRSAAPAPKPIVAVAQQQEPAGPDPVLTIPAPTAVPAVTNSAATTAGGEPAPTPAAAPAEDPVAATRRTTDQSAWNADAFRLALKERAAQ